MMTETQIHLMQFQLGPEFAPEFMPKLFMQKYKKVLKMEVYTGVFLKK